MLPDWLKSPISSRRSLTVTSPRLSPHFHCSSFKDIHTLLRDDLSHSHSHSHSLSHSQSLPPSPVFHRIRVRSLQPPDSDPRSVVIYFTSLRVVRRTFDDCRTVRSILRSFRVPIDERDLSMDSKFHRELFDLFGSAKSLTLPRVFIGGKYVGGAEEIKRMHETGQLRVLIRGLPSADSSVCDLCGGLGFVLCNRCHGSNKIYSKSGFRECAICNINGLVRCSSCRPVYRRYI